MSVLTDYISQAVAKKASDIFIIAGAPLSMKLDKSMVPLAKTKLLPPQTMAYIEEIYSLAKRDISKLINTGDDDFSFALPGLSRFRVNAYSQRGSYAAVIRIVTFQIPDWTELRIPKSVMELANLNHGLVLITGTAGSGKSTTLACILDRINHTRNTHIVTLEDPIEYLHSDDKSIISQREIAIDTPDFLTGLRSSLRQAPDVIQLGEMRDLETIKSAISAAETGHLLFATLHTRGASNSIDRMIDSFPPEQQNQIRIQLSMVLHTVIFQQLLPNAMGGMVACFEIMHVNGAIRNMIREEKTPQIDNAIATGAAAGMISMDNSILNLYRNREITKETALEYAVDTERMKTSLGIR